MFFLKRNWKNPRFYPEYIPRLIAYQLEYEKMMKHRGEVNDNE